MMITFGRTVQGGQTTITLTTLIFRPSLSSLLDTESLSADASASTAPGGGTETDEEDDEFLRESPPPLLRDSFLRDSLLRAPQPELCCPLQPASASSRISAETSPPPLPSMLTATWYGGGSS